MNQTAAVTRSVVFFFFFIDGAVSPTILSNTSSLGEASETPVASRRWCEGGGVNYCFHNVM